MQIPLLLTAFALGAGLIATPAASLGQEQKLVEQNPAAGMQLSAENYKVIIGKPPAAGSAEEANDLAILRWNQRTRYPQGVVHSCWFI